MAKHMCELSQSVKKNFDKIVQLVEQPRFLCTDCGRGARQKKRLCEPKRIPSLRRVRADARRMK